MFQFLIEVAKKFLTSKFAKFLREVFAGTTGVVLEQSHNIINENVKLVEILAEACKVEVINDLNNMIVATDTHIKEELALKGIELPADLPIFTFEDLDNLRTGKGTEKFNYALKITKQALLKKGVEYTEQALRLGIEMAVSRFFKK